MSANFNYDEITIVHFTSSSSKIETALVPKTASSDEIKELFRNAAEAGPCDIVKLYRPNGHLLNISQNIPPNDPTAPYRLVIVGIHCNDILVEEVGIDLLTLEKRVCELEKVLLRQESPLDSVRDLRQSLNLIQTKFEGIEHMSWMGFYKGLHPLPLPKQSSRQSAIYHSRNSDLKKIVCEKFLKLSEVSFSIETLNELPEVTFDNWQWEDEELLLLLFTMYFDLELPKKYEIESRVLKNFLITIYHHYNDVPFHNFRHSFCVTQMMYGMIKKVKLMEKVGDLEALILLTSCICHDLDHPGYNNIYQINAQTELALRYNDISPLENHHCSTAFKILEDESCNIFRNLSPDFYRRVREGMIRCILATDMARHNEIVHQFREIIPYFDSTNRTHVNLLTMVLIKVADISNEARPMDVAEPWLDCLLSEFFQQSDTEKLEGLPVTPFMDRDKITKPSSQCSFIGLVLLPLFEALAALFTELEPVIIDPVRYALEYYRKLNDASQILKHRRSTDVSLSHQVLLNTQPPRSSISSSQPNSLCDHLPSDQTVGSKRLRENSINGVQNIAMGSLANLPAARLSVTGLTSYTSVSSSSHSDGEEGEEEEMTEVAVSERALKFKIATESSMDLSASRKGSRENRSESSEHSHHKQDLSFSSYGAATGTFKREMSMDSSVKPLEILPGDLPSPKVPKDSLFTRIRLFTEKLSSRGGGEDLSPRQSSPTGGFSYFRKGLKSSPLLSRQESVEGGPSGASVSSSLKPCSGSLDSVLSKENERKSPLLSKKLMLPRFSSFVQKKTSRMGQLMRRSPKRSSPTRDNS